MATITQRDIITLDLNDRSGIHRSFIEHMIGTNDIRGNRIGVKLTRNGNPIDVSDFSCIGYFMRADGETVVINGGTADENGVLSVHLPQACYAVEGQFSLALKITGGGHTGTIRIVDGTVMKTTAGDIIDPGDVVPELTVAAIVAKISECEALAEQAGLIVEFINKLGLYVDDAGYVCQKLAGET